jgi:hypothetical protein
MMRYYFWIEKSLRTAAGPAAEIVRERLYASSSAIGGGHGLAWPCGLAEADFLVLAEIVHVEVAVGFEPVFVGLDG